MPTLNTHHYLSENFCRSFSEALQLIGTLKLLPKPTHKKVKEMCAHISEGELPVRAGTADDYQEVFRQAAWHFSGKSEFGAQDAERVCGAIMMLLDALDTLQRDVRPPEGEPRIHSNTVRNRLVALVEKQPELEDAIVRALVDIRTARRAAVRDLVTPPTRSQSHRRSPRPPKSPG